MYKLTFPSRPSMTFNSLDDAAEFMCGVIYGFKSCFDENGDDHSVTLCRLIVKKLANKKRMAQLKEDF